MVKKIILFLLFSASTLGFEKLPSKYLVSYGNPKASIQVVEYFSFTCPQCLQLIQRDFGPIKEKYLATDQICWTFHVDPADRLTLQAMVCLERLDNGQKRLFFEVISKNLDPARLKKGYMLMQAAMEHFNLPIPKLGDMLFLESTDAFSHAYAFLKQKDVITRVPAVEVNGKILTEFPTRKVLEKLFDGLIEKGRVPCE